MRASRKSIESTRQVVLAGGGSKEVCLLACIGGTEGTDMIRTLCPAWVAARDNCGSRGCQGAFFDDFRLDKLGLRHARSHERGCSNLAASPALRQSAMQRSLAEALAHFAGYTKADIYPRRLASTQVWCSTFQFVPVHRPSCGRRKTTLNWQHLKQLLQNPLQLLEKVGKVEVEGPRQGFFDHLHREPSPSFRHPFAILSPSCIFSVSLAALASHRKGLLPEHLHAYITQLGSPAEMDAEKAKDRKLVWRFVPGLWLVSAQFQEIAPAFLMLFQVLQAQGREHRQREREGREWKFAPQALQKKNRKQDRLRENPHLRLQQLETFPSLPSQTRSSCISHLETVIPAPSPPPPTPSPPNPSQVSSHATD